MSYRPLQPGDLGCDFSGFRLDSARKVAQARAAGCRFVLRYSAGAASNPSHPSHASVAWKLITPAEHAELVGDGFDVIANDEWYASRVEEGAAAGAADGLAAGALWKACGHARGASIYTSWDTFPARSKWWKVARYSRAHAKALKAFGYKLDGYAGTAFLRFAIKHAFYRYGWRPNAGSWSNDGLPYQPDTSTAAKRAALVKLARRKTPAHIWQTGNYWFAKNADENLIVRTPVGSHLEALHAGDPKPTPTPQPTPEPTYDMAPLLEAIMKLPSDSPQYKKLVEDIGKAAARHTVNKQIDVTGEKEPWALHTVLDSIHQLAKKAAGR